MPVLLSCRTIPEGQGYRFQKCEHCGIQAGVEGKDGQDVGTVRVDQGHIRWWLQRWDRALETASSKR